MTPYEHLREQWKKYSQHYLFERSKETADWWLKRFEEWEPTDDELEESSWYKAKIAMLKQRLIEAVGEERQHYPDCPIWRDYECTCEVGLWNTARTKFIQTVEKIFKV